MKFCLSCEEPFTPRTRNHKFCSARCGNRSQTRARLGLGSAPLRRPCRWCRESFKAVDGRRDYCSTECARFGGLLGEVYRKYGITKDEYRDLWFAQEGKCAICRESERTARNTLLAVDHDHGTGRVRGLLCSHCNRAIGLLSEDPEALQRAIEYLDPTYWGRRFVEHVIARRGGITIERRAS